MQRARSGSSVASMLLLLAFAASASAATLDQIRESGALRLGYVAEARPFSYRDPAGKPAGYAIALCEKVAAAVKANLGLPQLRTEFVEVGAEDRFDAVKQGKVDLLCTGGAPTVARRQQVSFSIPVFVGGIGALMREDAPASVREILEGRPEPYQPRWRASLGQVLRDRIFAVVRGTTAAAWVGAKRDEFEIAAKIETVDSFAAGVERVMARRADVFFAERAMLLEAAARSPAAGELIVLDRYFTYEAPALALPRGDEDFRLLVDRTLSSLFRSDEIKALYTPYFGKPSEQALRFFQASSLPD